MEEVEIGSWRKINVEQKYLPVVLYEKGKSVCAAEELSGCGAFCAQPHLACCFNREPREGARIRIIISVGVCSSSFMYH